MYLENIGENASALLQVISQYGQEKKYDQKRVIYKERDQPDGFFYVKSGLVGLWKLSKNGKQNLLRIYSENRFFGYRSLLGQDEYYASTIALKPSRILYFPFKDISELQSKVPEVFQYFTVFLASELKEAELRLTRASSMKMKHRVINTLLYLKKHHGDYTWTYREIGEYCGGETETVIRICNQLKHAGVLQKESRHWKIVNEQKLIAMQDEY